MAIAKSNKRLSTLRDRIAASAGSSSTATAAGAYTGEKPPLPNLGSLVERVKHGVGASFGVNTQSLATEEGVIPLPDEDELERVRRRRAARRGGGRASTVLTDENRLGG